MSATNATIHLISQVQPSLDQPQRVKVEDPDGRFITFSGFHHRCQAQRVDGHWQCNCVEYQCSGWCTHILALESGLWSIAMKWRHSRKTSLLLGEVVD